MAEHEFMQKKLVLRSQAFGTKKFPEKLISKGLEVLNEWGSNLPKRGYEKEINDIEVIDIEDNDVSLSALLSDPAAKIPALVVGDQFGKNATMISTKTFADPHSSEIKDPPVEV